MLKGDPKTKLDIPGLIQMIQARSPDTAAKKQNRLFPYIETYGKRPECEENLLMNKTIKFRESYVHNRTLRYMEPTFSYNQVLARLRKEVKIRTKPRKTLHAKAEEKECATLREIISRTEVYISKEAQQSPLAGRHQKNKSMGYGGIAKVQRIRSPNFEVGRMSPDMLQVTTYSFRGNGESRKMYEENATFYRDVRRRRDSRLEKIGGRNKQTLLSTSYREPSPKVYCDAVSNTELVT
jgi:hypothetical protein